MTELPGESSSTSNSGLTLQQFVYTLYAGRRLFVGVLLGVSLLFLLTAFLSSPRFTATASFLPPQTNSIAGSALMAQVSALGGGLLGSAGGSGDQSVGILKSQTVARHMIQRFNLLAVYHVRKESQAAASLLASSDFIVGVKDDIVIIHVTDASPDRARDMANAYLDELQDTTGRLALTESSQRRLFYEQRLGQEKNALANAEVALKENEEQTGLISPAGQATGELQAIAQLRAQIAQRKTELADLLHSETEQNPEVLRIQSGLASLQSQVAQMENGTRGPAGDFTRAQVPALQLDYIRLQREVKYHETLFDILSKQYEAARLDESHDTPVQVLDKAVTPDSKSSPHRMLLVLAGIVLGLVFGIAAVLLRVWWRTFSWQPQPVD